MSRNAPVPAPRAEGPLRSPWTHVTRVAAALAAGMGVGRFVYTPILPLMHTQAGLSTAAGAHLATANYVGYLLGALAGTLLPALVRSRTVLRGSFVLLIGTLAAMPATHSTTVWIALRLVAGAASALIFVVAVGSLLGRLRNHPAHMPGWGFGGVGAGIALSGLLVLTLRSVADWRTAWWSSAALAAALATAAWNLRPEAPPAPSTDAPRRWLTPGSARCSPATPWRASVTSSPGPSWSPPSDRVPGLDRQRRVGARRAGRRTVVRDVGAARAPLVAAGAAVRGAGDPGGRDRPARAGRRGDGGPGLGGAVRGDLHRGEHARAGGRGGAPPRAPWPC